MLSQCTIGARVLVIQLTGSRAERWFFGFVGPGRVNASSMVMFFCFFRWDMLFVMRKHRWLSSNKEA